jgi:hypothetical protein
MQDAEHEEECEKVLVAVPPRKATTDEELPEEPNEEELVWQIPRRWHIN